MTEEEKAREAAMRQPDLKVKSKMKFMQKYYHKGAFFNAEADDKMATTGTFDILNRDFSEAVGGDRVDKSSLPSVLHVSAPALRRFLSRHLRVRCFSCAV